MEWLLFLLVFVLAGVALFLLMADTAEGMTDDDPPTLNTRSKDE